AVYWDPAPLSSFATSAPWNAGAGSNATSGAGGGALSGGLETVSGSAPATDSALKFGSSAYKAVTMRKNEIMSEVLELGYHALFTDADTVWLHNPLDEARHGAEPDLTQLHTPPGTPAPASNVPSTRDASALGTEGERTVRAINPYLGHYCNELRLGDTVSGHGETPASVRDRADCGAEGVRAQYAYDVKGMYGDVGGMDTGYWYIRSTQRARDHMRRVVAFQRTPEGLALPSDQETFNEMLKPWLPSHIPSDQTRDVRVDSGAGLGASGMRVAMFDPLQVPSGCRLHLARAAHTDVLLVHANCRTGWFDKVVWLTRHGLWFVRYWTDAHVLTCTLCACLVLATRAAVQIKLLRGWQPTIAPSARDAEQ
ncbi:hypothetical protein EON67_04760, partial [archaeon]